MNTENIQSEKLELINWISQLQDVSLIEKLKKLYLKNKAEVPQWQQDIIMARLKDTKEEDYISLEELKNQIKFD